VTERENAVGRYAPVEVTPTDYERQVARHFSGVGADVRNLEIKHHDRVRGVDGDYVIDTTIRYEALGGAEFLVLVEAKLHGRPVERGEVQKLFQKVQSTGAHKGILVSSAGFQQGAVEFARTHGIALIQLIHGAARFEARDKYGRLPIAPESMGLAAIHVYGTDRGYGMTTLSEASDKVRELLPGLDGEV
jgi:restriction system protein